MIDLRRKAIDGLIDEAASMNLGMYVGSVSESDGSYIERTEWMDGWNAAVMKQNDYVLQIYAWFKTIPEEYLTLVEDLLLEGHVDISVDVDSVCLIYNCNDIFMWGCADCEEIPVEELKDFAACLEESPKWGGALWVARKRKERPQGAVLEFMSEKDLRLFSECGPKKPVGLGNPVAHPDDK